LIFVQTLKAVGADFKSDPKIHLKAIVEMLLAKDIYGSDLKSAPTAFSVCMTKLQLLG
jgi:hypothetical protein